VPKPPGFQGYPEIEDSSNSSLVRARSAQRFRKFLSVLNEINELDELNEIILVLGLDSAAIRSSKSTGLGLNTSTKMQEYGISMQDVP